VHPYLRRRHGEEEVVYPHPSSSPSEKNSWGPALSGAGDELAVVAADYTPEKPTSSGATWLRGSARDVSTATGSVSSRGCRPRGSRRSSPRGCSSRSAVRDYGFPRARGELCVHRVRVGVAQAALPGSLCVRSLERAADGFYSPSTIIDDAKRRGARVLPVDVQASRWDCTLERLSASGNGGAPAGKNGGSSGLPRGETVGAPRF